MTNASTPHGREPFEPTDGEPFFPSEGSFSTVVPLSEVGRAPAPPKGGADAGRPVEAEWAIKERRARPRGGKEEEEETLVPARANKTVGSARALRPEGARQSWAVTAVALVLSVTAGLIAGVYLLGTSQRAPEAWRPAPPAEEAAAEQAAPEAPMPPPTAAAPPPAADAAASTDANPGKSDEEARAKEEEARAKEAPPAPAEPRKHVPAAETSPRRAEAAEPRAERAARAPAETRESTPAPKPTRTQSAASARTPSATAERRPQKAAASGRSLPVSAPPPSARPKTVIQWP